MGWDGWELLEMLEIRDFTKDNREFERAPYQPDYPILLLC